MNNSFDFSRFIILLIKYRKFLIINFLLIFGIGIYYSFFYVKKEYVSSVTFFAPQENQSFSSLLQMSGLGSVSSDQIMPQQIQFIFESKDIRRKIIDKFNLIERYKFTKSQNKFELAIKKLKKDLILDVVEMGSLGVSTPLDFTISCFDRSPDTCFTIVSYTISLVDSTIRAISIASARKNRIYVENQLQIHNNILDSLQKEFGDYQIKNKIYDIPAQLQLSLNSYGEMQSKLLANVIQIKKLTNDYNNKSSKILELENEDEILKNELLRFENNSAPDVLLGFKKSVKITPEYTRFMKEIEVQGKLLILLTQQVEEAKLIEAKNMAVLRIIDSPYKPEYKIRPKRMYLLAMIICSYMSLLTIVLFLMFVYNSYFLESPILYEIRKQFSK